MTVCAQMWLTKRNKDTQQRTHRAEGRNVKNYTFIQVAAINTARIILTINFLFVRVIFAPERIQEICNKFLRQRWDFTWTDYWTKITQAKCGILIHRFDDPLSPFQSDINLEIFLISIMIQSCVMEKFISRKRLMLAQLFSILNGLMVMQFISVYRFSCDWNLYASDTL